MPTAGIKVLTCGRKFNLPYQTLHLHSHAAILSNIARFSPDVILTSDVQLAVLDQAPFWIRRRWIHVDGASKVEQLIPQIEACYFNAVWRPHPEEQNNPLISVYTGTYNTGDYLQDAYRSLREQTYVNWEWVVVDDASTDATWERLQALAHEDPRVRPLRLGRHSGRVGAVKDMATRMAKGLYLVELDHDDMLTDNALAEIRAAFEADPSAGMVYSNCAAFYENGKPQRYDNKDWEFRYRDTQYRGKPYLERICPDIYERFGPGMDQQFAWFLTMAPDHVRAFRARTFFELGGYNPGLPVTDDWDVMVRFYFHSKCVHLDKLLYLYRVLDGYKNTTFIRNQSIQDHLNLGRVNYIQDFTAANNVSLNGVKPEELLLTIVVCSIPERMGLLTGVLAELVAQAKDKPVEVVCYFDNRKSNLSEKRNLAIAAAKGRFVSFVDDDDRIEPTYVGELLSSITGAPDADCIVFDVLVHGYAADSKLCKYGIEFDHKESQEAYYRKPNHVMAYRTGISRRHQYRKDLSAISEDTEWAERASKDIRNQVRIHRTLYHYQFDATKTTQQSHETQRISVAPAPVSEALGLADVTYVVLEASASTLTTWCLDSIRKFSPGSEIVLVQNGTPPRPSTLELADKVIEFDANLGFAAGSNAGARASSRRIVCFMNNDAAFVDAETPRKLLAQMPGVIAAPYSRRAKPPQGDIAWEDCPQETISSDMVVGFCMMIDKRIFLELGGFDTRFLTYEDDDLCRRARQIGVGCRVVGSAWVDHERHATFKALGMDVQKIMNENGLLYKAKHPNIHVIVIAKNEETSIKGFFEQFKSLTRKWFVLDTGSTDKTVEIARAMGAVVESSPFQDFASARNEALDRFSPGADWVIMFDPDERLDQDTIANIPELLFRTKEEIFLAPLTAKYSDGKQRAFVPKAFLFRNSPKIRWVFKVHEKLIGSLSQALITNARIEHLIELHEDGRRKAAEGLYTKLMAREPYFADKDYKQSMINSWPILDYDRMDHEWIRKICVGPLISIVVPTYERKFLLQDALKSISAQDYVNWEAVVVGDHCPQLNEISSAWRGNSKIRFYNLNKNHGAGGAVPRNHAIDAATGEMIAYLDDDNAWESDHLSSLYMTLKGMDAGFAFSSMKVGEKVFIFDAPRFQGIDTSCILHRKYLIDRYGGWKSRVDGGYAHDWELVSRWMEANEKWIATFKPTLLYNAASSGQKEFLAGKKA